MKEYRRLANLLFGAGVIQPKVPMRGHSLIESRVPKTFAISKMQLWFAVALYQNI